MDGRTVARAVAVFAPAGGLLLSGGTLPEARGRGAYRALVRARWDEAVRRGTPALAVQASKMSRRILERLGFSAIGRIQVLADEGPWQAIHLRGRARRHGRAADRVAISIPKGGAPLCAGP